MGMDEHPLDDRKAKCQSCDKMKHQSNLEPVVVESGNTLEEEIDMTEAQIQNSEDLNNYNAKVEQIMEDNEIESRCESCRE